MVFLENNGQTEPLVNSDVSLVNSMKPDEKDWDSDVCGCISCERPWVCFLACVCPCLVFGEIYDGLKGIIPADTAYSGGRCNSAACEYCLLDCPVSVGCSLLFTSATGISLPAYPSLSFCLHHRIRTQIRQKDSQHPITGTSCEDIFLTFCVPCCALVQEHKQVFPLHSH